MRELTETLRLTLLNAAADAPTRSTLRESESGALVEDLFELATLTVFSHSSSEFHRPRTRRVTQGTRRRGLPGRRRSIFDYELGMADSIPVQTTDCMRRSASLPAPRCASPSPGRSSYGLLFLAAQEK